MITEKQINEIANNVTKVTFLPKSKFNPKREIKGFFVVGAENFEVFVSGFGNVNTDMLKQINENIDDLRNLLSFFKELTIHDASQLKAFIYVGKNMTENWSVSPYSQSFYNSKEISWGEKPENSLRVSDHWNFESNGTIHCQTKNKNFKSRWAVGEYVNGSYKIIKTF